MREYLLVFLVAAGVDVPAHRHRPRVALRTGAVAKVRDRDVHAEPIPYFGGLAMLGGLGAAYLVAHAAAVPLDARPPPWCSTTPRIVLIAGAMICAVGVLDDLFELDALTKLGGQVLAAGFLVAERHPVLLLPAAPTAASSCSTRPRARCSRLRDRRDDQRRELRRRARRPCRRRRRHRRASPSSCSATS